MKKILNRLALSAGTLGVIIAGAAAFSAFEAHVINVTAKIENAMNVPIKFLDYGTVFPQEYLVQDVPVTLSASFLAEGRVDDVEYFIRQKPKCAITTNGGTEYDNTVAQDGQHAYTRTGHVVVEGEITRIDCGEAPRPLAVDDPQTDANEAETWDVLPSLCPYLSKHKETDEGQTAMESQINAFHQPYTVDQGQIVWNDAKGYLTKLGNDTIDTWLIDLAVPCFGGYCAQDWAAYVADKNPNAGDAEQWTQPIANEHKIFGCDLWIEVAGVSQTPGPEPTPTPTPTGTLTIVKEVINDSQVPGTATVTAFSFIVDGGSPVAFEADGSNSMIVTAGDHVVTEPVVAGYTATFGGDCDASGNVTVPSNGTATCTITNNDDPTPTGTLVITKILTSLGDNQQNATSSDFSFQVNGGSAVGFEADGSNSMSAIAGAHVVAEVAAAGFTPSYSGACDASGNVTVIANDTVTCIVTNTGNLGPN